MFANNPNEASQGGVEVQGTSCDGLSVAGNRRKIIIAHFGNEDTVMIVEFDDIPVEVGPIPSREVFMVTEHGAVQGNVLDYENDAEEGALTVLTTSGFEAPFTTAHGGALVLRSDGTMSYTPAANFSGNDSFDYTVSNGVGGTATSTLAFNVAPATAMPKTADSKATALPAGFIRVLENSSVYGRVAA